MWYTVVCEAFFRHHLIPWLGLGYLLQNSSEGVFPCLSYRQLGRVKAMSTNMVPENICETHRVLGRVKIKYGVVEAHKKKNTIIKNDAFKIIYSKRGLGHYAALMPTVCRTADPTDMPIYDLSQSLSLSCPYTVCRSLLSSLVYAHIWAMGMLIYLY